MIFLLALTFGLNILNAVVIFIWRYIPVEQRIAAKPQIIKGLKDFATFILAFATAMQIASILFW